MHRPSRRVLLALTAVLAGGAAVAGGTMLTSASEAAPAPSDGTLASAEALERLHRLPPVTDRVFAWTDAHYRGAEAQRRYAIDCMARQGFRYAPPATPAASDEDEDQRPRPFGLETAPSAAPPAQAPPGEKPPKPGSPEASPAFAKALFGDQGKRVTAVGAKGMKVSRPGNGCLADAEKRVLGDGRMRWLQVRIMLFEAQEQARTDVEKDPAFRNATGRWQQCMERAGFPGLRDPLALPKAPSGAVLKADLRCKSETGYLTTAYTRLAAVQQRWLDANPAVVKDWTALLARQDTSSREVLAGTA
ncbi:hypothetical protein [Streptomyces showdoensis]|uniref:Tat pathway signal sequence domain protein n=1 Tax=Streptomyces showdoensis TaxID=68268 RepID=A0A2P2GTV3_STREW|nr:hypothetical protein [Streptomyces showdoensis]KKZ74927.1 hypothetical protein VO63_05675 [Streptomyces showdoensis]